MATSTIRRAFTTVVGAALLAALAGVPVALATNLEDFTVTPATGGGALTADDWSELTGPTIQVWAYSNPDVLPPGTLFDLSLPPGVEWDRGADVSATIVPSPGMPEGMCELAAGPPVYASETELRMALGGRHDIGCTITFHGLRVRALAGAASLGQTGGTLTVHWTVPGLGTSRGNGGDLTIVGAVTPSGLIAPAPAGQTDTTVAAWLLAITLIVLLGVAASGIRRGRAAGGHHLPA